LPPANGLFTPCPRRGVLFVPFPLKGVFYFTPLIGGFGGYYPLFEIISSLSIFTISIVFPNTLIIPSLLKSDRVLITFAVLIPI
jgi:hypothetical protein